MPAGTRARRRAVSWSGCLWPGGGRGGGREVTWAPWSYAATSNEQRVRVEVFSKIRAMFLPRSRCRSVPAYFACLTSAEMSSRPFHSAGVKSSSLRKLRSRKPGGIGSSCVGSRSMCQMRHHRTAVRHKIVADAGPGRVDGSKLASAVRTDDPERLPLRASGPFAASPLRGPLGLCRGHRVLDEGDQRGFGGLTATRVATYDRHVRAERQSVPHRAGGVRILPVEPVDADNKR